MSRKLTLVASLAFAFFIDAASARADGMKVSDLESMCKENSTACRLFIWGIAQGFGLRDTIADRAVNGKFVSRTPVLLCMPDTETVNTLALKFRMKLAEDLVIFPNDRTEEAPGFAVGILVSLFPCKH